MGRTAAAHGVGQLRSDGAAYVYLAGRRGTCPGVDDYIFDDCDAVTVLSVALDRLGVSR